MKFQGGMFSFCDFIQVFVFTTNHHLKANYNEILILMSLFSPSVICLQKTFLKQSDNVSFRDFKMFNYICPDGQRASGGTSIMVKSNVPHSQFYLNTNLQAVAVNVNLSKKVTICSIYLPPSDTLSKHSLVNLIDQLPHPFMLVGDFNGHSKVWGCSDTNDRGEIMKDVIAENDLCLLMKNNLHIFILLREISMLLIYLFVILTYI